ncbi:protein CASC1 isoform X2 [Cyclopterus lumpus]|uniref:protein CASC1 isoform X2 n=1 Tax=Cyclopterus lumpus TaxID=8103 RepID=UPI0014875DC5|nr:protein CASC1 isoform X2 [Cyclopterus lumpus]
MRRRFYGYTDAVELSVFTMPPKKRKSKTRKLTKAQRAKQQQEEEERCLREEEEARLQAEKDERDRLERERKKKEHEILEFKDLERREDELNELRHLLEVNHTAALKWKTDAVEKAQWERYTNCGGIPDPAVQKDINTYVSLWKDDPEVNVTPVLKQCNLALQLTEELEGLLRDVTDPQEGQKYQESLLHLLELIHSKHLLATEEILKRASANIDTETGNMQTVVNDDNITLCLWANLKKNPRFKGLNFGEAGPSFNLPKQLAVSNIAVRILHTRYDHLSLLARMAPLRIHTPSQRSLAGGEEVPADMDVPEQGETGGEGEEKQDNKTQQQDPDEETQNLDQEVQSIQGSDGSKSAASLQSMRNIAAEGRGSQIQTQMEALDAEGDLTSPPEQQTSMDCSERVQVVDLMQYTPLGGVFYYDAFHLPPQAHQVNGWEIRQLLQKGLQVFPYPMERSNLAESEALACPPVGVSVTLPDSVVFLETPQVALWDAAGKQWRMDGITDVSYDEAEAKISLSMDSFQAFVLMQDTYANLPFQSWELRPLGQDSALFTINGALVDLSITIHDNQCMLQSEQERGLAHLIGKWMSGPVLQRAMLNAGINIFVSEYTDKYVSTCGKDPLTEHAAYEQMALFASACAFSWSKWNSKCGAEHLVMQVCEHHSPAAPVPKDSWSLYLLGARRSQKLEITEKSEAFSPDHYPGSAFHSTFIHMLQDTMSTEGIARTRLSNYLFVDTVHSLLSATRPLMYS